VVENDVSAPSRDLVSGFSDRFSVPVIYGIESERGIASARNRAVQLAGNVDFIAFIDDDEVADACWLDELLDTQNKFDVDVVNGPVVPRFEQPIPPWVLKGGFYNRRRLPTGTKITWANTGNVMIRTHWLSAIPGPFETKLNLTGGSDTLLFSQVNRLGAKMVWSNDAIVEEYNPGSRVTSKWILRRAYRNGIENSALKRIMQASPAVIFIHLLKSIVRIFLGILLLLPALFYRGYAGFIRSLMYVMQGTGEINGIVGIRYMEYRHTHGS
jgi:glycosyltransferase involved in cell wall biosynthesis